MTPAQIYQLVSVLVLAALLFFPVSRLIWVLSVRRLQRRTNRELDPAELNAQLRRARFITVFAVVIFSYLFHTSVLRGLYG